MNLGSLIGYLGLDTKDWDKGLDKAEGGIKDFAKRGAVLAAAAGVAIAAAVTGAVVAGMNIEAANDKVAAQLGLSAAESERVGGVAGKLYANAYGDSIESVNGAVAAVMSSIDGMSSASSADLEAMTARALDFATAFEVDVTRSTQIAGQMITQGLAKDGTEAFDLLVSASQQVPAAIREDLLDATDEYGGFFADLGYTGPQAMALLVDASEKGMYGLDKLGDAVKEFGIRATDMSTASAVGYDLMGMSQEEMTGRLLAGGETARTAFQEIIEGVQGIKDPVAQSQAALALFGTPLEDLSVQEIPAFLDALAMSKGELENVAGASERMGDTLNDNASTALTELKRGLERAVVGLADNLLPAMRDAASWLKENLGPALIAVKDILVNDVGPALKDMKKWIEDNETPIKVVSGLIAALFIPHLIALAAQSVVTAATSAASWIVIKAQAIGAAVVHSAQILMMIGRWVALAASAVVNAAIVVAAQVGMAVSAVVQAAIVAAAWLGAQIRTVASLVVMAAGFVAQGAVMVASAAVTAAGVVASWVLMGAQAMANAVRMAAAWVIAMGPVGWAIALIIGLVALIALNWDKVKEYTRAAWDWVSDKVSGAWRSITSAISSGVSSAVSFVRSLPGKILGALGDFGGLLYGAGKSMIQGLLNGAGSLLRNIGRFFLDLVPGWIRGPFEKALGINSPSKVFAGYGKNIGQGLINGMAGMQPAVAAQMLKLADTQALSGLGGGFTLGAAGAAASAAPGAGLASARAAGPLFHADTVNVIDGTPQDIAQELAYQGRTRGW